METNRIQNLLLAQAPPNVQAQAQAGEDAVQRAGAPSSPYGSRMAGLAKALQGGLGGLMEGQAMKQAMDGQQQGRQQMLALADALHGASAGGSAAPGGGTAMPMPTAVPLGQGGIGSDAVASGSARNPPGYDPAAARAYILQRAPAYGITSEAAHAIARSEGLNVYVGDHGSSFGPFQLHYGGVASGGNAVGGLGDDFTKKTGLDARDPSTVKAQIDFALAHAAQHGWGAWHGRQTAHMGEWDGIGRGGSDPGINVAGRGPTTAAPGINAPVPTGARNTDPGLMADMPAPNATPTGMQGLPPGVTPEMWAASQNKGGPGDGNALRRGDEAPAPGPNGPPTPPIGPATSNAALADALQNWKPDLGQTAPAAVPDPVPASAPDAPPAPSILPPARPPSGDAAGAPVVPAPQGSLAPPPAAPAPDPVAAGQMQGRDVALDPVVPDPVGDAAPAMPSSPNSALQGPQSDAAMGDDVDPSSLRGQIMAAMGGGGAPPAPAPAAQAPLPDTAPLPPPGAQSLQAPADAASAAAAASRPELDPEAVGLPGAEPSLRDHITAAMDGGSAPPAAAPIAPAPGPSRMAGADVGDPGLDAMRAGMAAQALGGAPPPAAPPLPTMAQAGAPGPTPMPPQPGTGAALPQTGPTPPPGGQTPGAGSSLPQTGPTPPPGGQSLALADALANPKPAPQASPQALAAALDPPRAPAPQFGGSGTNAVPGNSPSADPASAQNFMRAEAARAQGGGGPAMGGQGLFALGGAPSPGPAPNPSAGPALAQGGGPGAPMQLGPASPAAQAQQPGTAQGSDRYAQARAVAGQILSNPYARPEAVEMAGKILFPQAQVVTGADGKTYAVNPQEGTARLLFDGGANFKPNESLLQGGRFTQAPAAPMDLAPGHLATTFGANNQAVPQVRAPETPDVKPVDGTPYFYDAKSGRTMQGPPGMGASQSTIEAGGAKVPSRVVPNPDGTASTQSLAPGAAAGQGGDPLAAVKPLVSSANQMQAEGEAAKDDAKAQVAEQKAIVKAGQDARRKLAQLDQLEQLSGKFGNNLGTHINAKMNEWGMPTQSGTDQEAFKGLLGAMAVDERPVGSGPLRVAEMDAFKNNLGSMSMNQAGRMAAIDRYRTLLQRDARMGDIAGDPTLAPAVRASQLHALSQQPYGQGDAGQGGGQAPAGGQPQAQGAPVRVQSAADYGALPSGARYVDPNGNVRTKR